jgi:hypothetical protein
MKILEEASLKSLEDETHPFSVSRARRINALASRQAIEGCDLTLIARARLIRAARLFLIRRQFYAEGGARPRAHRKEATGTVTAGAPW